ncbi:MAG: alpha/beta hydrolase [bacterium]|nr:alpha/beta hydrolase [Gammaproteobacteria bacterium]
MESRKQNHNGIETAYRDTGGDGIPFLLVHGFTGSMLDFQDEMEILGKDCRTITMDQRGHGDSTNSREPSNYDLRTLVDDLLSFIEALNLEKLDILGHSLGGMVVMRAVLARPDLFRSMLLMDTAAEGLNLNMKLPESFYPVIREKGVQALLGNMKERKKTPSEQNGIDYLGETEHWRRIELKLTQMDPEAFIRLQVGLSDQVAVLEDLKTLHCPTTILLGENDVPFIEPSKRMHACLSDSEYVEISYASHCPQYESVKGWRDTIQHHFMRLSSRGL